MSYGAKNDKWVGRLGSEVLRAEHAAEFGRLEGR